MEYLIRGWSVSHTPIRHEWRLRHYSARLPQEPQKAFPGFNGDPQFIQYCVGIWVTGMLRGGTYGTAGEDGAEPPPLLLIKAATRTTAMARSINARYIGFDKADARSNDCAGASTVTVLMLMVVDGGTLVVAVVRILLVVVVGVVMTTLVLVCSPETTRVAVV